MSASPVTLAVVGAGDRGQTYAEYARQWPRRARVVAVAEPSEAWTRSGVPRSSSIHWVMLRVWPPALLVISRLEPVASP